MDKLNDFIEENFKYMYYYELERKENIYSSFSLPVGVTSLLFGIAIYYAQGISLAIIDLWTILFIVCYTGFFLSLICTIYFLLRALYKYRYSYLPTPQTIENYVSELRTYHLELKEYNKENNPIETDELLKVDLQEVLINLYIKCSERNTNNNDMKITYRHKSHTSIIASLIFLLISFFPYYIIKSSNPEIQKVEIINLSEVEKNYDEKTRSSTEQTNSTTTATPGEAETTRAKRNQ